VKEPDLAGRRRIISVVVKVTVFASVVDEGRAPNRCIRRGDATERQCLSKALGGQTAEGVVDGVAGLTRLAGVLALRL
jgi:hypothetical protein